MQSRPLGATKVPPPGGEGNRVWPGESPKLNLTEWNGVAKETAADGPYGVLVRFGKRFACPTEVERDWRGL